MLLSTIDYIPGRETAQILGLVSGSVVSSKHLGKDFMAGMKTLVGGEIRGYTEMLEDARRIALERIQAEAARLGADAIVGIRLTSSSVMQSAAEVTAYGTAVKLR